MNQLTKRERELVAIGAAIGSNCASCIEFHIPEARSVGLTDGQIQAAIELADAVRTISARNAVASASESLGTAGTAAVQPKETTMSRKPLLTLPLILILASPVLAEDDKALLAQCDIDRNGVINKPAKDLPPAAWAIIEKELVCQHEFNLDLLAKDIPDIRKRCAQHLQQAAGHIDLAWKICAPHVAVRQEKTELE